MYFYYYYSYRSTFYLHTVQQLHPLQSALPVLVPLLQGLGDDGVQGVLYSRASAILLDTLKWHKCSFPKPAG